MIPEIPSQPTRWQVWILIGVLLTTVATATAAACVGGSYAYAAAMQETNAKYIEVAVAILREEPKPNTVDIRDWAADLLDHYSAVKLTPAARAQLKKSPLPGPEVSVELQVNGQDGPISINAGELISITRSASNATACQMSSPTGDGGVTPNGTETIEDGHPWYPKPGGFLSIHVWCQGADGRVASDTVIVNRQ